MGCGPSFAVANFDYASPGPSVGAIKTKLVSQSHMFCLAQHAAEWPDYYCLVDCRTRSAYDKGHVVNAQHVSDVVDSVKEKTDQFTVIVYGDKHTSASVSEFLDKIHGSGSSPSAVYILEGAFSAFMKKYKVAMSSFTKTQGEHPGPIELVPSTKLNPAVYVVHRNQFQHCKTTVAYLGCNTVINISSRRLFLKTAAIRLENLQFDSVSEPYDEAISMFNRYILEKPRKPTQGNILLVDETGCDYGSLLVGWFWFSKGHDLEKICEHLQAKLGELDSWYLDVLRAWAAA